MIAGIVLGSVVAVVVLVAILVFAVLRAKRAAQAETGYQLQQ